MGLGFELGISHLSHTSHPFCSGYFWRWSLTNYFPGLASNYDPPCLTSQVVKITEPLATSFSVLFFERENMQRRESGDIGKRSPHSQPSKGQRLGRCLCPVV
jgi:hypothetical protein